MNNEEYKNKLYDEEIENLLKIKLKNCHLDGVKTGIKIGIFISMCLCASIYVFLRTIKG